LSRVSDSPKITRDRYFLVADLDTAILRYKDLFDIEAMTIESLPERGVRTARFKLSGVWIVLVQPVDEQSEPMRHLREHGDGLYLVSFAVDDLDAATVDLTAKGAIDKAAKSREGLQGWRVIDLEPVTTSKKLKQPKEERIILMYQH
jgi:methylmalonyl-CoA/ethylmalonyl-CoA epimerase